MMWMHVACELLLAACCLPPSLAAGRRGALLAAIGFGLIGVAAFLGAWVYAGAQGLVPTHELATFFAARLSLFLIAVAPPHGRMQWVGVAAAGVVALLIPSPLDLAVSVLALGAIAWKGRSQRWPLAVTGAALFALAGLVVGTQGAWLGIPRVDLYHLSIAAAVLAWLAAGVARTGQRTLSALSR